MWGFLRGLSERICFLIREFRSATKIATEEGPFILRLLSLKSKIKVWMPGRRFLAYFFGAVAKEVRRQQAKLEAKLYA